jgi:hypothetical protein
MQGLLTSEIKSRSIVLLGYEITETELKLLPYVQYLAVNNRIASDLRMTSLEKEAFQSWKEKGWVDGGFSHPVSVTQSFWEAMSEIIWLMIKPCN